MGSFTEADYLPSLGELKTKEIPLTINPMKAASRGMATFCDDQYKEFMMCRNETQDIRKCIGLGKEVTQCGNTFLKQVKAHCDLEFTGFWRCIDRQRSHAFIYSRCRKEQSRFNSCLAEQMNVQVPDVGYFSKVRLHEPKNTFTRADTLGDLQGNAKTPDYDWDKLMEDREKAEKFKTFGVRQPMDFQ